jgi:hypothetical protein
MPRRPSFRHLVPAVLALGLLAHPSLAQGQESGTPRGGQERGSGGRESRFDPIVLEGPPAPEEFAQAASLNDAEKEHYSTLYANFMANTRVVRDSLRQSMRSMRGTQRGDDAEGGAPDPSGGRGQGRDRMAGLADLRADLERQQRGFDNAVKNDFGKDHFKQYQDWCDQRRKEVRSRRRGGEGRDRAQPQG